MAESTPELECLGEVPDEVNESVRRVELIISSILRFGVIASLTIVIIGIIVTFSRHPVYLHSPAPLKPLVHPEKQAEPEFPHTIPQVIQGLAGFRGQAIIAVGLLLLISTPVIRVAVSIFVFLHQKDRFFTIVTIVVLALLLLSFFLGKAEGG
jgi:uncharacterized membrane protein